MATPEAMSQSAAAWQCLHLATHSCVMEVTQEIQCPYCGQGFDIIVDTSLASQRFITDCEICCRPLEVAVECEPGEILSLEVLAN